MTERPTPLLSGLTAAQREAVTVDAAPLCLLAGAGSGKTRVLTRRIAWRISAGAADASHVVALTFTRKAAGELRDRLTGLGVRERVAAGTFHGLAYAQLRRRWADRGEAAPALLDRKVGLLRRLLQDREPGGGARGAAGGAAGGLAGGMAAEVAAEIEWAKARLIAPGDYARAARQSRRRGPLPPEELAEIFARYEAAKRRRGVVDFDDLLVQAGDALEQDPEFAAGQRWRFRHFFVDEFQDVNPAQFRLLSGWLGGRTDLCVVGDPNQAIYSWNGADPALLTRFGDHFPGATVVRLDDNFRSSPQILAAADAVLGATRAEGARPVGRAGGTRAHSPEGPPPSVRSYPTDQAEAAGVARALRLKRRPNTAWSGMAVLARTNAQLLTVQAALRAAAVPCRVTGDRDLLQRPEVRTVLDHLRQGAPAAPFLERVGDLPESADPEVAAAVDGIGRLAQEYADLDPAPSVEGFLAWLHTTLDADTTLTGDAVELTTFHRAKGLEWPIVFLVGLEQGLVPIGHATTPAAEAEERRLLYVAMTRAEVELHCSWAERRAFSGRMVEREPSPWLDAIELAARAMEAGGQADPAAVRQLLAERRAQLGGTRRPPLRPAAALEARADPGVLADLKAWRASQARASGVPAYVIFHDATLAAVAEARPQSAEELLGLPGLGPVKAARYGDQLLALVARHEVSA